MKDEIEKWTDRCPLRKWRLAEGETIFRVAVRCGASTTSVQNWENGTSIPGDPNMARIAKLLDVDAETLAASWKRWWSSRPSAEAEPREA